MFFSFNFTFRFAILSCLTPLKKIPLRFPPCLFTFASPQINARSPSLGARLSLFSEVSYYENKTKLKLKEVNNMTKNS